MNSDIFGRTDAECVNEMFGETLAVQREDNYRWLSCWADDRMVGFACYGMESLTHGTWDLFWVCVSPAARGRGAGGALLRQAVSNAQASGGRLMVIYTSSTEPYAPARALYESQSFDRTATVPGYYDDGDDLYIYSRRLATPRVTDLTAEI